VCFEESGLVSNPRIAGSVRFIEGVFGKFGPVGPYFFNFIYGSIAIFFATVDEFHLQGRHFIDEFFSHGFAELIGLSPCKPCQVAAQKHDLLLIHRNSVGFLQAFFHDGKRIVDGFAAVFTVYELGDVLHRTRSIQGIHGDKVLELGGLQFFKVFLHPVGFELESTHSKAFTKQFVGFHIIDGNSIDINILCFRFFDVRERFFDDRQGFQPQEVHFDESDFLYEGSFILGHQHFLVGFLVDGRTERYVIGEVVGTDNHPACMHAGLAHSTFEHFGITKCIG